MIRSYKRGPNSIFSFFFILGVLVSLESAKNASLTAYLNEASYPQRLKRADHYKCGSQVADILLQRSPHFFACIRSTIVYQGPGRLIPPFCGGGSPKNRPSRGCDLFWHEELSRVFPVFAVLLCCARAPEGTPRSDYRPSGGTIPLHRTTLVEFPANLLPINE